MLLRPQDPLMQTAGEAQSAFETQPALAGVAAAEERAAREQGRRHAGTGPVTGRRSREIHRPAGATGALANRAAYIVLARAGLTPSVRPATRRPLIHALPGRIRHCRWRRRCRPPQLPPAHRIDRGRCTPCRNRPLAHRSRSCTGRLSSRLRRCWPDHRSCWRSGWVSGTEHPRRRCRSTCFRCRRKGCRGERRGRRIALSCCRSTDRNRRRSSTTRRRRLFRPDISGRLRCHRIFRWSSRRRRRCPGRHRGHQRVPRRSVGRTPARSPAHRNSKPLCRRSRNRRRRRNGWKRTRWPWHSWRRLVLDRNCRSRS